MSRIRGHHRPLEYPPGGTLVDDGDTSAEVSYPKPNTGLPSARKSNESAHI